MKKKKPKKKIDRFSFFRKAVISAFDFLTSDYGFKHVATFEHPRQCALDFWNQTTAVSVSYEPGSAPWVVVGKVEHASEKMGVQKGVGLWVMVEERCPAKEAELDWGHDFGKATKPDIEAYLRVQAKLLKKCAAEILRGDFSAFPVLRKRRAAHARRQRKELSGTYCGETPRFSSRPTLAEVFAGAKTVDPKLTELFGDSLDQDQTSYRIYEAYWDHEYPVAEIAKFLRVDEKKITRALDEMDDVL